MEEFLFKLFVMGFMAIRPAVVTILDFGYLLYSCDLCVAYPLQWLPYWLSVWDKNTNTTKSHSDQVVSHLQFEFNQLNSFWIFKDITKGIHVENDTQTFQETYRFSCGVRVIQKSNFAIFLYVRLFIVLCDISRPCFNYSLACFQLTENW